MRRTDDRDEKRNLFEHGSADTPEGTNLIITILASDGNYEWDRTHDRAAVQRICEYMGIACGYIERTAREYGKEASFVYDFFGNEDLLYYHSFENDLEYGEDNDPYVWNFIDTGIPVLKLMHEYDADNVIFFCCMNTDRASSAVTCTRNWYEGMEKPYEIVYLFNVDYQTLNPPAVYAHEIYHTFGAPDYYAEGEEYNLTRSFVRYAEENLNNDIMYSCSDMISGNYNYDTITNTTGELTAYYIGLTDHCDLADELGLGLSQHAGK